MYELVKINNTINGGYMKKIFVIIIFLILGIRYLSILNNHNYYQELFNIKTNNVISFGDAPRGNIYDINGNLIVSNREVLNIAYIYIKRTNIDDVINALAPYSNYINISDNILKDYYIHINGYSLLTSNELKLFRLNKISDSDVKNILYERIDNNAINYDSLTRQKAYIYYLINKGSKNQYKILFNDVTLESLNKILDLNIPGIVTYKTYERYYHYDTYLNSVIGSIGKIPKESLNKYLKAGYSYNDLVGTSYLENIYEPYLRGEKAVYKINKDNSLTKIQDEKKGNDLILNIDINLQMDIENILKDKLVSLKKLDNTEYYNTSYVIISDPSTGGLKALAGVGMINDNKNIIYINKTLDIFTKSYVMGSVIKGASQSVGYKYNLIDKDKVITDSCVKLNHLTPKCSFKSLGKLNDITALKWSSNYYQFITAIKSTNNKYRYNMDLKVDETSFKLYRDMFKEYGLGTSTGIDMIEFIPKPGSIIAPDLLLNLSIGQYDPYTPISLTNYINTIANNGIRYKLNMVKQVIDNDNVILNNNKVIMNEVSINKEDLKRIQTGFIEVLDGGTGRGYINLKYKPAGKTGTSETFIDTNNDGIQDTKTITETSAMFYPYDNPKYSIVIISPNSSHYNGKNDYIAPINSQISKEVTKNMFEKY